MISMTYQLSLLKGIAHGERAYVGPYFVNISVTQKCNIRCVGCFYHCIQDRGKRSLDQKRQDLSLRVVEKLCQELPIMGTREVFLTGEGEPMLHPRLIEIINVFKLAGLRVSLFTNGTLLTKKNMDRLLDSGLDVLKISIWAVNLQEHEDCHPGVDSRLLEKRIKGIRYLSELKKKRHLTRPEINLNMIINRHNFKNISGRVDLAKISGCNSISFSVFRDYGGLFQDLSLTPPEIVGKYQELREAKRNLSLASVNFNLEDYLPHAEMGYCAWGKIPCYAGWFQASINIVGDVLLCPHCNRPVGNVNEQSFASIWNGAAHREFRRLCSLSGSFLPSRFDCDCANCCITKDNLRVYNKLRWFKPFLDLYRSFKKPC
jgi:MoaA/NifB/PqqE/SkfB family radical SAM enzyme